MINRMSLPRRAALLIGLILALAAGALADGTLTLPDGLGIVEESAFEGAAAFDRIQLPDEILEIRSRAFAESGVREINLPASLTFIADDAFEDSELEIVMVPAGCYAYDWAVENGYITENALSIASLDVAGRWLNPVQSYTWTAAAQFGVAPYQYRFTVAQDGRTLYTRGFSTKETLYYTFFAPGGYTVSVQAKDAQGALSETCTRQVQVYDSDEPITGLVRVYVYVNSNGSIVHSGTGHYELQINTPNGAQLSFNDRLYTNPVFSYGLSTNSVGIVDVFEGSYYQIVNSDLYGIPFTTTAGQLNDFLIEKLQLFYLNLGSARDSGVKCTYTLQNTGFSTYEITTYNCFTAAARWCSWLGYDALSSIVSESSSCSDYFTFRLYDSRYTNRHLKDTEWTLVAQVR